MLFTTAQLVYKSSNSFSTASDFFYYRYNDCKDKLTPYLKKVGFNPAKDLKFMPCSGLTGAGLKEPVGANAPWYT